MCLVFISRNVVVNYKLILLNGVPFIQLIKKYTEVPYIFVQVDCIVTRSAFTLAWLWKWGRMFYSYICMWQMSLMKPLDMLITHFMLCLVVASSQSRLCCHLSYTRHWFTRTWLIFIMVFSSYAFALIKHLISIVH